MSKTKEKEKEYNLKCFWCKSEFKSKKEVFRTLESYALCYDCMYEYLTDEGWEDPETRLLDEIKDRFEGKYKKFKNWFYENHTLCDGDHGYDNYFVHNDTITKVSGKKLCEFCHEVLMEKWEEKYANTNMSFEQYISDHFTKNKKQESEKQ